MRVNQQVAATDVDFIFQHKGNGFAGGGFLQVAVEGDDTRHARFDARRQHLQTLANLHGTGGDRAGEAAEIKVRTVNILHREAQRLALDHPLDLHGFEDFQQRRATVPRHIRALAGDIIAFQRRQRHKADIKVARQLLGKGQIIFPDLVEARFAKLDEIHFVDRHYQVFNAQQRRDEAVTAGLVEHALARIDQQDRQVAGGRAGGHIARVLLVPRGVGDDKFALFGREVAIGHVDGDALLALSLQAVHQQRQVQLFALGAVTLAVVVQRRELVFIDLARIVQQAAN